MKKTLYKLQATLDLGEIEDLFRLINKEITRHSAEAKLKMLDNEITKEQYICNLKHAEYFEELGKKLKWSVK